MSFYFSAYEDRVPPPPVPYSARRELLWQYLAVVALVIGAWYLHWRWTASLNFDALWFALPLVLAETASYVGLILFVINLWAVRDEPIVDPPASIGQCLAETVGDDRPVTVDVFFTTYNEDTELVRFGLQDAKRIKYPHAIDVRIHVLDDGRRAEMRKVAEEEGVGYITRTSNVGFKAGNLRNAMELTSGDFIVICDADTRPFPTILSRTLGYFRDPRVAWVQTPQWFFDLDEGRRLPDVLKPGLGRPGRVIGTVIERVFGEIRVGIDPLVNDPAMFYDIIQRRRNWANAAFCCGAGSIHRRDAVMEAALKGFAEQIERGAVKVIGELKPLTGEKTVDAELETAIRSGLFHETEFTPYKFHVSEDIYTSIVLHSDQHRRWRSVFHPLVESKALSPQDLLSWTVQRFKYAGGSLDILFHDNPLLRPGLSLPQRLMYAATFWSYLAGIWNTIFLLAPIVYLVSGVAPVSAYSTTFFLHVVPFLVCLELAMMVGTWGISGYQSQASYLSFFAINLRALWTVLKGQKIRFPVTPKDRQSGRFLHLVRPQLAVMLTTAAAIVWGVVAWALGLGTVTLGGLIANTLWGFNNILALSGIVRAAIGGTADDE